MGVERAIAFYLFKRRKKAIAFPGWFAIAQFNLTIIT